MINSDKNGYLRKENSDPTSQFLTLQPPFDDLNHLKNDRTKNLFIYFNLENEVEKLCDNLIAGTLGAIQ